MNEDRTRTRESRAIARRRAGRALTLATLLGLAASGPAWAQTAPPATTPATPAAPAVEAKPGFFAPPVHSRPTVTARLAGA